MDKVNPSSDTAKRHIHRHSLIPDDEITSKDSCSTLSYLPEEPLRKLIWVWRIDNGLIWYRENSEKRGHNKNKG